MSGRSAALLWAPRTACWEDLRRIVSRGAVAKRPFRSIPEQPILGSRCDPGRDDQTVSIVEPLDAFTRQPHGQIADAKSAKWMKSTPLKPAVEGAV
jgi:hypothetical protein